MPSGTSSSVSTRRFLPIVTTIPIVAPEQIWTPSFDGRVAIDYHAVVNNDVVANKDIIGLFRCVRDSGAKPDPADWERCSNYYFMQFNSWEYFYYQYADGSIPPQLWRGADAFFKQEVVTNSGFARYWSEAQIAFDEPFRSYVMAEFAVSE